MDAGLLAEVVDLLAIGCEGRDGQACMELAVHCGRDITLPTCLKAGVALLPPTELVACSASGADGISECREHARSALFRHGYASGERDCASGIARACFILAYSHEVGYGHGDHDTPTALLWYRRGCAAGDADSCGSLAVVLRHDSEDGAPGSVPEADSAEFRALQLREERCEAGDALVCFNLARSFESGQFPAPIDPERAALLEAKACELGLDRPSCP